MKSNELFRCKFVLILMATIIVLLVLLQNAANLENDSRHLDDDEPYETHYRNDSTFPAHSGSLRRHPTKMAELYATEISLTHEANQQFLNLQSFSRSNFMLSSTTAVCTFADACAVSCSGGTIEETIVSINALFQKETKCASQKYTSLILERTSFTENSLNCGWLKEVTVGISSLKMVSIDLEDTEKSPFSGKPFGTSSNPLSLSLINTAVGVIRRSMFENSSISSLEIAFNAMSAGTDIEENVFGKTSSTVHSIVLKYCLASSEALKNLTGKGNILIGLLSLDLSYNLIPRLENGIFSKAPNLQQLYLISSGISDIELGAFEGLTQVKQLHLSNNNLKTLPEGLFDDMRALESFYISGNPWKCDCNLKWFSKFLDALSTTDSKMCRVGSEWINMEEVDFCPANNSTSNSTSTTTPTTTTERSYGNATTSPESSTVHNTTKNTVSTNKPSNGDFVFEKIKCRNLLMYSFDDLEDDDKIIWYESIFKRRNVRYIFSEVSDTSTFVLDLSVQMKPKDFLIWTNVKNRSDYGCVFNISSTIVMNLEYENTYTICLSSNDTTDTYALIAEDCIAVATPPDWPKRAWIINGHKIAILVGTIFTFIVTIIIATTVVYCLVKSNPELIKGNKRVLIVKRGSYSPNILVMPSKKDRSVSLCTDNEGYLTPKLKHWIKQSKLSQTRYEELETITDGSSITESACESSEKHLYEPPPVPPNHPTKRRDSIRPYFYSNM